MPERVYDFLFILFSPLCHQITERSFQSFDGLQFFVCARDTGTYLGFLFSFIMYKKNKFEIPIFPLVILFFIHLLLFGLDGLTSYMHIRETNNFIRYFTGFYFGFFLGLIFQYLEFFLFKPSQIVSGFKKYEGIHKAIFVEFLCSILFVVTLLLMKYLLYLLVIAIFFYMYKLVGLILRVFFMSEGRLWYYLAFSLIFILIFSLVFSVGINKIHIVHKFYR